MASAIFFIGFRFVLARFEYFALRYDIKKISAIMAIIASYVYYKIANSPLPSQRAMIMVWLAMASLLFDRRFDSWRAIFLAIFLLTISNPYNLLQISFQLSFIGVLVVISYINYWRKIIFPHTAMHLEEKFITTRLTNFLQYFFDIFFITLIIQIVSIPILMNSFQTFSIIAFVANLIAIPLVSFFIMPIAILLIFLMIIDAQNLLFWWLNILLDIFVKMVNYFANFKYAIIETLPLSSWFVALCLLVATIFFITENKWLKIFSIILFIIFIGFGIDKKNPQIIIEKNQKFLAIYDEKKLFFSKKLKPTNQIKNYLKTYQTKDILQIKSCQKNIKNNCQICKKNYCDLFFRNKKILVLKKRQKINKLCKKINNNYFAIINMTKKFQLPNCINNLKNKIIIIDNKDFINKKTIIIEKF
jgi:ComEC/Rec2-related protein